MDNLSRRQACAPADLSGSHHHHVRMTGTTPALVSSPRNPHTPADAATSSSRQSWHSSTTSAIALSLVCVLVMRNKMPHEPLVNCFIDTDITDSRLSWYMPTHDDGPRCSPLSNPAHCHLPWSLDDGEKRPSISVVPGDGARHLHRNK